MTHASHKLNNLRCDKFVTQCRRVALWSYRVVSACDGFAGMAITASY